MSADTFVFVCSACRYKARIPVQYRGATIRCPGCKSEQVAAEAPAAPSTGHTVLIQRVASTPVPFTLPVDQEAALAAAGAPPADPPIVRPSTASFTPAGSPPVARPATGSFARTAPPVARPASGTYPPSAVPVARPATGAFARANPPVAKPASGGYPRTPSEVVPVIPGAPATPAEAAGIEFVCPACAVRVRIPGHYLGKSILCPRCSTPQKVVDSSGPLRPMDTTRALRGVREVAERADPPAVAEPRPRPDTTDIVPQQASVLPGQALEPEPNTARPATASALTRSDGARVATPRALPGGDETATAPRAVGAGSPRRPTAVGRAAVPAEPSASLPPPPPLPSRAPLLAAVAAAVALLLGLIALAVLWRAAEVRARAHGDELALLRAERVRALAERHQLEERMAQLERSLSATATVAGLPAPVAGASEAAIAPPATAASAGPGQPEPALPATAPLQ